MILHRFHISSTDLDLQYVLDAKKDKTKRLFFLDHEGESTMNKSISVTKGIYNSLALITFIDSSFGFVKVEYRLSVQHNLS